MSAVFEIRIETDADGVIRVAGTRVNTLVAAFSDGATAEELQEVRGRPSWTPWRLPARETHAMYTTDNL